MFIAYGTSYMLLIPILAESNNAGIPAGLNTNPIRMDKDTRVLSFGETTMHRI
jgi:hypothetical protein